MADTDLGDRIDNKAKEMFESHPDLQTTKGHPELQGREDQAANDASINAGIDQAEAYANDQKSADAASENINAVSEQETTPSAGLYRQTNDPKQSSNKGIFSGKLSKGGPIAAITGFLVVPILIFMALLPLKLFGLVANMTEAASAVPAYAAERRVEYLVTRAFSTWLIKKSSGANITDTELENKAIFCKGASIGCSLTMTRIGDYFDKRYNLDLKQNLNPDGTRRVTVTPIGRDGLGQKARGWVIDVEKTIDGQRISKVQKTIESNSEMKREIRRVVSQEMNTKSVITRYIARKVLMKRYGVTMWRGFEKTSNKLADKKASFKAGITKNTVGRVSPKMASYLACLSGGAACEKLKQSFESKVDDSPQKEDESDKAYKNRQDKNEAYSKAAGISPDIEVPAGEEASKFLSKQLFSKLAGGAGIAGILDMLFGAIGAIDEGALESIMYDIKSNTYVGYAFGDDTGIIPNIEKFRAGDSDDPDLMPMLAEQLENVEQSPVWQAENGMVTGNEKGGWSRICDKDGKPEKVVLKDQYVCPERQLAQSVTGWMDSPTGKTIGTAAEAWNSTAGKAFDFINWAIGGIMEKAGINWLIEKAFGGMAEKAVQWLLGLFFDIPAVGGEATGDQNYDALSSAVWISQNGMMENGVDEDGDLLGGGGKLLSNNEVSMIQTEENKERQEHFNSQSQIAKVFDVNLRGSFMNSFLARIPMSTFTSTLAMAQLPSVALASTASILTPHTSAASAIPNNPHNIPLYGYTPGDAALTTTPSDSMFSAESCETSAKSREDSYTLNRSKYAIKTYTKSDPCALEKMAVGTILQEMGVKDDPNSFKEIDGSNTPAAPGNGSQFRIATFNLRGASHTDGNSIDSGEPNPPDERTTWKNRAARSVDTITSNNFDVIAFQEFEPKQRQYIDKHLPDYSRSKQGKQSDAIMWNKNKFSLVDKGTWKTQYLGGGIDEPWVRLKDKSTEQEFYVMSVHDPINGSGKRWSTNAKTRSDNARKHLEKVKKLSTSAPVILLGDFNSSYKLGKNDGAIKVSELSYCILTKDGTLNNALDLSLSRKAACPQNKKTPAGLPTIDHIYLTSGLQASSFKAIASGSPRYLKNGSDHPTVYADIVIPSKNGGGDETSPTPGGSTTGDDYKTECSKYLNNGYYCPGLRYAYNCTAFVNFRLAKHGVIGAEDIVGGSGSKIVTSLAAKGFRTGKTPQVNAVFSTSRGGGGNGHTGMVSKVNSDGSIVIEEYNYTNKNAYGTRTLQKGSYDDFTFAYVGEKYK